MSIFFNSGVPPKINLKKGEVANGYWTCNVVAAEVGEMVLTPLYSRLFSQNAPDFRSENQEIFRSISMVSKQTDKKGTYNGLSDSGQKRS